MMEQNSPKPGPQATKHIDILWAATHLFATQGVAQTTTRQIAQTASTTERTLFKHFADKQALVDAVIKEAVLAQTAPASLQALAQSLVGSDVLSQRWHEAFLQDRSQRIAQGPELFRLLCTELLRDENIRQQFAKQWLANVWHPLQTQIDMQQKTGLLRDDIPAASLARIFLSLNLAFLLSRYVLAADMDWDEVKEISSIARFFAKGARA